MDSEIALFWLKIVQQHPELEGRIYHVEHFGTPGDLAQQLSELIVSGEKYATCSALDEYWHEGMTIPTAGYLTIVLDGHEKPVAAIETMQVSLRRFRDVDAIFAAAEGEGDKSLAYWRQAHQTFFETSQQAIDKTFSEDMWLVCEYFRLLGVAETKTAPI
ncbi:ASCH domain-containing protein [Hafnia sp. HMSC23F03]|uniref:ASCH domain-containing protein n=1 Tax=Hafnia sp. HMSC23F03 TaxID=1581059 RepID=UPI0008A2E443|nr:ASCH domain-containing protein [Hafnia sp. HMSC23F03]OFS08211.1 RNA-binding protein [Hafnia sp. HMSC23F03]